MFYAKAPDQVNFGDGTSGQMSPACSKGSSCPGLYFTQHTYTAMGTYTAKLLDSSNNPLATAVVTVALPSATSVLPATPTSGPAPLTVTFTPSFSSATDWTIYYGDGQSDQEECASNGNRIVCSESYTHTYASPGIYTAVATIPKTSASSVTESATITVTNGGTTIPNNGTVTFTASPDYGTAPLTVQFTSTGPQGSNIGSTVNFGDGTTGNLAFAPTCSSCNELSTVSHIYASAGPYTATLIDSGGSTLRTASVIVGENTNPNTGAPIINSFTATPSSITAGQSSTLSWSVSGATSVSISGIGTVNGNSVQVSPAQTTTYTVTATNSAGSVRAQTAVTVTGSGGGTTSAITCLNGISLFASITPASGPAPLTVRLTGEYINPEETLDFGDGSSVSYSMFPSCPLYKGYLPEVTFTHMYLSPGTYAVNIVWNSGKGVIPYAPYTPNVTVTALTTSASDQEAQLANAYTALISVLQQLIASLSH
jgi:PKD repeat protein